MLQVRLIIDFLHQTFSSAHLQDCSKGGVYEKRAAYQHNRAQRPMLLKRMINSLVLVALLYALGFIADISKFHWTAASFFIGMTLSFIQAIILGYGYLYLGKWSHWNSGI